MRELICNVCGRETIVDEDSLRYHAYFCRGCDTITDHKLKGAEPTVFDCITSSHEALAEKLVYAVHYGGLYFWHSTLIYPAFPFETKEEAITATIEKLKEIEKNEQ